MTSCTVVPLPRAMRRRRLPLMIWCCRRSCGVIESMMAIVRPSAAVSTSPGAREAICPIPGMRSMSRSSGPIRFTVVNWSRMSCRVKSFRRILVSSRDASSRLTTCSAFSTSERTSPMPSMRDTRRSGWKGWKSSMRSPSPTKVTGTPTTETTDRAAPPRASPSILVSTTPSMPTRRLNSPALLMASWPVIASAT